MALDRRLTLSAATVSRLGEALYGANFKTPLAAGVGIRLDTMRAVCNGRTPASEGLSRDILVHAERRQAEMAAAIEAARREIGDAGRDGD